jgi:mRNA interferase RelE/StbE
MVSRAGRELKISKQADRFIRSLPEAERQAVKQGISRLIEGATQGLDMARLLPHPREYRLKIGKVRILFESSRERLFIFKAEYRGTVLYENKQLQWIGSAP